MKTCELSARREGLGDGKVIMQSIRGPNTRFYETNLMDYFSPLAPIVGDGQENSATMSNTSA